MLPVRAADEAAAARRVREEVLGSGAFPDLDSAAASRLLDPGPLEPLVADFTGDGIVAEAARLRPVEVAIHCAATVSFEEALDDALALNAYGPRGCCGSCAKRRRAPSFVHVSTAYVADRGSRPRARGGSPSTRARRPRPEELMGEAAAWRGGRSGSRALSRAARLREGRRPRRRPSRGPRRRSAGRGAACGAGSGEAIQSRPQAGDRSWAGRTPTRSRRRSASGWSARSRPRRRSSGRRSSSRRCAARDRGLARGDKGRRPADPRLRLARAHRPPGAGRAT